jgi:hypothetical protein
MTISKQLLMVATLFCLVILLGSSFTFSSRNQSASATTLNRSNTNFSLTGSYMVINVSDYSGATDSERIQKALNDVPPEGAIVFIPEGIWEACNLTAISKTIVMGTNGTILKRPINTTSPFIKFQDQASFAVVNLTFDGQNITEGTGISVTNGTDFEISDDTFENVEKNAVYVCGVSEDFKIENNVLVNSNTASILVFGSPGVRQIRRFLIANNTLMSSTNNGKIGVAFAAEGTIADNRIIGDTYGIGTRDVSNITIRNNWIENCTSYGIYLGTQPGDVGSSNIEITGNYIVNSNVGIARYYGDGLMYNITLRNNTIIYNAQSDIYADFQAAFINNTMTYKEKLKLLTVPTEFVRNIDNNSTPIIPADVTGDGKVDMRDVAFVARLYGSTQSSGNWNPKADIIQDGVVDMRDIGFAAKCFGYNS